jgi:hypothetical protein
MGDAKAMKKAQSTLEYLIMLTVIVGAIILASGNMQAKIQAGRNVASTSIGNSIGLNPSIQPIPVVPANPDDPNPPSTPAQALIPRSMYLTPSQLKLLDRWGILQSGRSDYDPMDGKILMVGKFSDDQVAAIAQIQREQDAARQRAQAG